MSCGNVRFKTFTPTEKNNDTPTSSLYSFRREKRDADFGLGADSETGARDFETGIRGTVYQILTNLGTQNSYSIAFQYQ